MSHKSLVLMSPEQRLLSQRANSSEHHELLELTPGSTLVRFLAYVWTNSLPGTTPGSIEIVGLSKINCPTSGLDHCSLREWNAVEAVTSLKYPFKVDLHSLLQGRHHVVWCAQWVAPLPHQLFFRNTLRVIIDDPKYTHHTTW